MSQHRACSSLVVIGGSPISFDALTAVLGSLPAELAAPIIVAEQVNPHRLPSGLGDLEKQIQLPVKLVTDSTPLVNGEVFLIPPRRDVVVLADRIQLGANENKNGRSAFDRLIESASQVFGEDLIAVFLDGTGPEGSSAARLVRHVGGTVIIQDTGMTGSPGFPMSLAPTDVDISATPERIGEIVQRIVSGEFDRPEPNEQSQLATFLDLLRDESGIDFSTYKQPTILRRMRRRIAATGQTTIAEYARFVRRHPEERQRLFSSFLIKVTEFFRDPELFDYFREHLLPELIAESRNRGNELRIWSAGCATGEEAYSLAITLYELLEEDSRGLNVRIFATDLDGEAIAFARRGVYPASALESVPKEILERHFTERDGEFEISKTIRSLLIFGEHDLGHRAPFPRVDLVLCRNVLIYFTPPLQRRVLQLFAFSLRVGGYLAVGKSETVGPLSDYFATDEPRLKVFRRSGDRAVMPSGRIRDSMLPVQSLGASNPRLNSAVSTTSETKPLRDTQSAQRGSRAESIVHGLPVGVVLLNRDYDIQSINAVARRQLGIHSSAAGRDLLHLVRNFSVDELRRAIDRAFSGEPVSDLVLTSEAGPVEPHHALEITCYPVTKTDDSETFAAVVIADVTVREQISRSLRSAEAMVRRLTALNDEVLSANIELTNTIAKLRTDNEELLVASEEVQAATEEVETLNEELQASNEELETLNEELHATVEELNTTNDDLEARAIELQEMAVTIEAERARLESVLNNIGEAVMVIGRTGDILISNPAFQRMFGSDDSGFQPQDESGNPMLPNASPIARAARGETFSLTFTTFHHGIGHRWFEAEGRPVPWYANESAGVVTIRDITDRSLRHLQEQWLSSASHELRTPLTALQVYLQLAVRQFQDTPDSLPGETIGRAIDQSKRIATLIDQIVDAARYQQAPSTVQPREIDLVALVERTVRTANDISGNPRVSIEMPLDKPLLMIEGDPELLQQMIYNVIENAVTFSSPEETVQVQLSLNAGHAEITVGDSGPGIDSSDMPQIFERSIRGNEAGEGLGLGLYVAREIVGQHAGTIDATPSDGPGSAFRIRLPLHRA